MAKMTESRDFQRIARDLRASRTLPSTMLLERAMAALARIGSQLRQRYENECSYEWANTPRYEAETEALETRAKAMAERAGLFIYVQTDCRGATIYVSGEPIEDSNYNRRGAHCLYFKGKDY